MLKTLIEEYAPSMARIYRKCRDRIHMHGIKPYDSEFGFVICGDTSQVYGSGRADRFRDENQEISVFLKYLKKSDLLIDIGANFGLFTLLAAQASKGVLAIEPSSDNYKNLLRNIHKNGFKGIESYHLALGKECAVNPLFGSGEMASLNEEWGTASANYSELVSVNTLDNLCLRRFQGKKVLIKLDAEGFEFPILQGANQMLNRDPRPIWLVEHGLTENFPDINPHFEDLFRVFWNAGYRSYTADRSFQEVTQDDIAVWLEKKSRTFGGINYLFKSGDV